MIVVERIVGEDMNVGTAEATVTHPGGGTLQGTQINLTTLSRVGPAGVSGTTAFRPGTVQPLQAYIQVLPDIAGGAAPSDLVLVTAYGISIAGSMILEPFPVHICYGFVSQADEVTIVFFNPTTAVQSYGSGWIECRYTVFRMR